MPKPKYLQYDSLDDRRTIHQLLERLSPAQRIDFLDWCGRQCPGMKPHVARQRTIGTALEIYLDIWHLAAQYNLNIDRVTERLVAVVRRENPCKRFLW